MARGNSSFSKLITTTLPNHGKEIVDAVSTNNALFYFLNKAGNIKLSPGGRTFTHPIYHIQNSSFGSYGKLDTISTGLQEDITRAEYDVKCVAGSIVISKMEEAMNAGNREKLIDLVIEAKEGAKISMTEVMGDQVWKDGSTANDFDGIQSIIPDVPSSATSIGGIDSSDSSNSWWRAQLGTNISAFNTSSEGITNMNSLLNSCIFGSQGPTLVATTKTVYALYELSMQSNIRYYKESVGDSTFQYLAYSTMPVVFDDNCPAGHLYMLDLKNIRLQLLREGNFRVTSFQDSPNQLLRSALMYVFGNITTGSLRTNGVITSIA